jgi:hypothetical protein
LFSTLRKTHNSDDTDPQLVLNILIDDLDRWFRGIPFDRGHYPHHYHPLIHSPTAIGWRHLFNGHLMYPGEAASARLLHSPPRHWHTHKHRGGLDARYFGQTSWTCGLAVILRSMAMTRQANRRLGLVSFALKIEFLHTTRNQVLAVDTDLFIGNTPAELDHYLSIAHTSNVQNWLNIWKPIIIASIKTAKTRSIQGIGRLQSYFRQTRAPASCTPAARLVASQHQTYGRSTHSQRTTIPLPLILYQSPLLIP